jgi:glycosyltransferase involved in cell wall biosynthesis
MDPKPNVSIVIPVYNGSNYLNEAINSVLNQTYTNYEIIVVDDGSTDTTWNIIQSYRDKVRGYRKDNEGVASALNLGIQKMHGRYFAWLSHDDLWLPEKLEKQINFLILNPDCKISYTDYYLIGPSGDVFQEIEVPWYPRINAIRELFKAGYIHGSSVVVEKMCLNEVGYFSTELKYTQDTEMWIRLLRKYEIGRIPEKLIKGRRHENQYSKRYQVSHVQELLFMLERTFLSFDVDELFPECKTIEEISKKKARAYTWFGDTMGHYYQFNLSEKYYRKSIDVYPSWKNIARIHLVKNLGLKNLSILLNHKNMRPIRCYFKLFIFQYQSLIKKVQGGIRVIVFW